VSDEAPPWLDEFALHIRNQTLMAVAQGMRLAAKRGLVVDLAVTASLLEKECESPAGSWWPARAAKQKRDAASEHRRLPILGPFPCGASRCSCSRGGCDALGTMSAQAVQLARARTLECGDCGTVWADQDPLSPCGHEDCGGLYWLEPRDAKETP
jgi:hypothetical protein